MDHNHSNMASEIFLAVFRARFDALYDASNESGLRWWINENIRDFIAPTFIHGNPLNTCTVQHEGHCRKVLLWIMEEFPQPDRYYWMRDWLVIQQESSKHKER